MNTSLSTTFPAALLHESGVDPPPPPPRAEKVCCEKRQRPISTVIDGIDRTEYESENRLLLPMTSL
jgi:hypothetical protein